MLDPYRFCVQDPYRFCLQDPYRFCVQDSLHGRLRLMTVSIIQPSARATRAAESRIAAMRLYTDESTAGCGGGCPVLTSRYASV